MKTDSRKHLFQVLSLTLCVFAFVGMLMIGTATTAFCEDNLESIENAFSSVTEQGYKIMRAVVVPCCIVALAFAGFHFLVGGSQGGEKARKTVIGVCLAMFFVVFAPMAVNTVANMVAQNGNSGWDNYNPLN